MTGARDAARHRIDNTPVNLSELGDLAHESGILIVKAMRGGRRSQQGRLHDLGIPEVRLAILPRRLPAHEEC